MAERREPTMTHFQPMTTAANKKWSTRTRQACHYEAHTDFLGQVQLHADLLTAHHHRHDLVLLSLALPIYQLPAGQPKLCEVLDIDRRPCNECNVIRGHFATINQCLAVVRSKAQLQALDSNFYDPAC